MLCIYVYVIVITHVTSSTLVGACHKASIADLVHVPVTVCKKDLPLDHMYTCAFHPLPCYTVPVVEVGTCESTAQLGGTCAGTDQAQLPGWARMSPSTWWTLAFRVGWTTSRVAAARRVPLQGEAHISAYIVGRLVQKDEFVRQACWKLLSHTCRWNAIDSSEKATDCFGHGSALASIAAGTVYGVAKSARIVGVRVLDCTGKGGNFLSRPCRSPPTMADLLLFTCVALAVYGLQTEEQVASLQAA
jgi:subtilisin family serine protease